MGRHRKGRLGLALPFKVKRPRRKGGGNQIACKTASFVIYSANSDGRHEFID